MKIKQSLLLQRILSSKLTYISLLCILLVAALVGMQNNVLPSLLSNQELSTLNAIDTSKIEIFGFALPSEVLNLPFTLLALLSVGSINAAYITAGLFMFVICILLGFSLYLYHRSWPAFVATLLFASLSGGLTYSYGLRPELIYLIQIYLGLLATTLVYRKKSIGHFVFMVAIALGAYMGPVGFILSALWVSVLIGMYIIKECREVIPKPNFAGWLIILMFFMLLLSPMLLLLNSDINYGSLEANFDILTNLKDIGSLLLLGSSNNPFFWPATWPIVSAGGLILTGIGMYALYQWRSARRNMLFFVIFIIGLLLPIVFGLSLATLSVLIGILPIIIVTSLRYLHDRWLDVFPLNPTAHNISIFILSITLIAVGTYHLTRQLNYLPQVPEFEARYTYEQTQ